MASHPLYIYVGRFIYRLILASIIFFLFFYLEFKMKDWAKKACIALAVACLLSLLIAHFHPGRDLNLLQSPIYDFVLQTLSIAALLLALYILIHSIYETLGAKESFTGLEKLGLLLQIATILLYFIAGLTEIFAFLGPALWLIIGPLSYRRTHRSISRAFFLWGIGISLWLSSHPIQGGYTVVMDSSAASFLALL